MDEIRGRFHTGRRDMIAAFAALSTLALRAGVDEDAITDLHGQFFDGNVAIKESFGVGLLVAAVTGRVD